ncbi:glutathione S-transferase [Chroococcidiopsis sp. CCALA 051]|uniref:glutathione S-transferase family protein n=1 Tax=Chroococcidiopsis sp. CCALA 051 TaxID=869949 RepID=UPI000D0E2654|nr:glutathione S-transferase family protein [Chroococcidiopsis sp. CCALA 051]MBE9015762.1 glutathione S-transferase family protein [Chroococcidiopsidales cyanobacterium LEGE 13417]PSM46085.1 glutathione S-transferase [Chroococcidiopsis sp. CCALA 051]
MQKHRQKPAFRLITIPVSHYCEKARWALERLNIPYIEERHVPPMHRLATSQAGGSSVPVLITEAGTFTDSTEILHYLDRIASVEAKLYPTDPQLRYEVEQLADLFDTQLGPSIRCWGYFYVFDNWQLMQRLWGEGTPPVERALFPIVFPIARSIARRIYNITAESAASSLDTIKSIFEMVNNRLADGRRYLVEDRFSAADLSFACFAAPILATPEYSVRLPGLRELPNQMAAVSQELQAIPAGAYAIRLFREERGRDRLEEQESVG